MPQYHSPFLEIPESQWLAQNEHAFAIYDGFPVSPGHSLVVTKRLVPTWFDASSDEQASIMALVNAVRDLLLEILTPVPVAFNVGFNAGAAAGQTVPHVHIHVIPRYPGDVPDPRGGVRHVIPGKGNYLADSTAEQFVSRGGMMKLSTGHPNDPLWNHIRPRLAGATEVELLASFIQPSGLDLIQEAVFSALRSGARIRVLVGDYLAITSPDALRRLLGWIEMVADDCVDASLQVRLVEIETLASHPKSFHPKAWRIADESGGVIVVGSSNLSRAALQSGIEWNLVGQTAPSDQMIAAGDRSIESALTGAFTDLWEQGTRINADVIDRYAKRVATARASFVEPESIDTAEEPKTPRPWQVAALEQLARIRADGYRRALVAVATGLGKTWLAAFDVVAAGQSLRRPPRVLVIAHRSEILAQAEATLSVALRSVWEDISVTWYLGASSDMTGSLVVASIQKLTRPEGLGELDNHTFDYVVIDEVHHAQAPSYRRVLARIRATFALGLTATPERTDGVDVATLFDDVLAWQATVGDGIAEGSLVPFHYLGIKDDVDFAQIPWRNGRFDTEVLERQLENSARMERLWKAWQEKLGARTLIFCCSRRHALFTRNWLRRRGVAAAAVFSGTGGDNRSASLADFVAGKLDALCVVDLFNEGLDVPDVDRIVMLRPTESKVIFLQQLGRGLRAAEAKSHLDVIDFVGNHRVFANRLIHLLSLGSQPGNWARLNKVLDGGDPELPEGCLMHIEVEAKDVLRKLVPTGGTVAIEAYRGMRDDLQRRPTMAELYHHGYLPSTIRAKHGAWFEFVADEADLSTEESEVLEAFGDWLKMLEITALNNSYKMVVLRVLLDRDALWDGMEIETLSAACREFLLSHPSLRNDLPPTKQFPDPATAPIEKWAAWWRKWPLDRWMDQQNGRRWFRQEGNQFVAGFACPQPLRDTFETMTGEIVDYRLAHYHRTRLGTTQTAVGSRFIVKVSHSSGKPILRLPTVDEQPGRPIGPTEVQLPDGTTWIFKFVKIACNVAAPIGTEGSPSPNQLPNQLPTLMREWFGENAGAPGTDFRVAFSHSESGWSISPVAASTAVAFKRRGEDAEQSGFPEPVEQSLHLEENPDPALRYTTHVPAFSLEAAAGLWGPEMAPEEIGWTDVSNFNPNPGMFVAKVRGRSMEPKITDGSWCLFRPCPAGTREGRIVLVQFNSLGDPEDGGRFTVKKYRSEKTVTESGWSHQRVQLLPTNPDYTPIEVDPEEASEMVIVGELVAPLSL
ncbi:MAG: superfamily II DNA or RNA helicase/diadenosine tetraphosphate (Ap4A) HIT family hydrolase [Verrucomicrobiales bacterium]|jgi:superfamily II DNA or RNA helicase/diadenosine tetraphosphate (Ap4A) HIT family hydrolase/HKD family nuclease/SOS-response transcriptional repressor LexA